MNPTIQSGIHPDAESLTAFAEQLLSGAEKERILAHMAICSRCREVVFLAQRAMDAEEPAQVSVERAGTEKEGRGWFGGWRWMWIPVAALAGFVGFAVVQHVRRSAFDSQMARRERQTEVINGALAAKAASGPVMQQVPKKEELRSFSAVRKSIAPPREEKAGVLDEKKAVEQKDQSKQTADAANGALGVAGGAMGTPMARAKSSAVGGPMAQNQMQQQNAVQQNALVQAQAANEMSNKPIAPPAVPAPAARPDAVSESVDVQPVQQGAPASASHAEAREMTMVPVTGKKLEDERDKVSKLKGAGVMLPGGLEALSVATVAQRVIAIDPAGALFVSEDSGKHWQPVKTQWNGRAVLVRTRQMGTHSANLANEATPQFELMNDKLQTWVSVDGRAWTEKTVPGN